MAIITRILAPNSHGKALRRLAKMFQVKIGRGRNKDKHTAVRQAQCQQNTPRPGVADNPAVILPGPALMAGGPVGGFPVIAS